MIKRLVALFLMLGMLSGLISSPANASNTSSLEENWRSVASSTDGTKLVAVARGGKIYVSNDSGSTWSAKESNRDWRAVASSADGTKLVAVTNDDDAEISDEIYVSNDAGYTWFAVADVEDVVRRGWTSVASSADGTKLVATTNGGLIYVSADSGDTWSAEAVNGSWTSVASSANGTKLVATQWGSKRIYESNNSGITWQVNGGTFPLDWSHAASSADGEKVIAAGEGRVYVASTRSSESPFGLLYDQIPNQPGNDGDFGRGGNWKSVASSSDGSSLVAVEFGGQIWVSKDAGQSWTAKETNRDWLSVASSGDGTKLVAVVESGAIYVSGNSGDTWVTGVLATDAPSTQPVVEPAPEPAPAPAPEPAPAPAPEPAPAPAAVAAPALTAPTTKVAKVDTFKLNKFGKNSAVISKSNKAKIAAYSRNLKVGGYTKVTVRSFTKNENAALANKRAAAVAKLLKKYGVTVVIRYESVVRKQTSLDNYVRLIVE